MPSPVTPDQILDAAPKVARPLKVEANTVAYFADLFWQLRESIRIKAAQQPHSQPQLSLLSAAPLTSDHRVQADTASAQNPS
jgi:hypothetical protein